MKKMKTLGCTWYSMLEMKGITSLFRKSVIREQHSETRRFLFLIVYFVRFSFYFLNMMTSSMLVWTWLMWFMMHIHIIYENKRKSDRIEVEKSSVSIFLSPMTYDLWMYPFHFHHTVYFMCAESAVNGKASSFRNFVFSSRIRRKKHKNIPRTQQH